MDNDEHLVIAYGDENISLNKGNQHIILDEKEISFLIKSLLKNKSEVIFN